jgi:hypothetical protein
VDLGKAGDFLLKSGNAQHFAEDKARIVEAQSLVEITDQKILFGQLARLLYCLILV